MIKSENYPPIDSEFDYQFNFMFNDICNVQCPYCIAKRFETEKDLLHNKKYYEKLLEILKTIPKNSKVYSFTMGGEPLFDHKKFLLFLKEYINIAKDLELDITIETPSSLTISYENLKDFIQNIHYLQEYYPFKYKILASYHYESPIVNLSSFTKNIQLIKNSSNFLNVINVLFDPQEKNIIKHFKLLKGITKHKRTYLVPIVTEDDIHTGIGYNFENEMFKLKQYYNDGSFIIRNKDIIYQNKYNCFQGWNCDLINYCVISMDGNAYHCSAGLNHFDGIYEKPFHNILKDDNKEFWNKTKIRKCKWKQCTCEIYRTKFLDISSLKDIK